MKIDEGNINHNALRLINELLIDPYSWCYGGKDDQQDQREAYNCILMTIGNINGILAMAQIMKEVLRE